MATTSEYPQLTQDQIDDLLIGNQARRSTAGNAGASNPYVSAGNAPVAPVRSTNLPKVAAPEDTAAAPTSAPSLPVVGANIAKPTTQQSIAVGAQQHGVTPDQEAVAQFGKGKSAYQAELPQVTAKPFSPEHAEQEEEQAEFKRTHPLGGDVSERPGVWGKLEHGLAKAGNIAGNVLAPGTMENIPGTDLYNREQENRFSKQFTGALANQAEQQGNELIPFTDASGNTTQIERKQWAPLEVAGQKAQTQEDIADKKVSATDRKTDEARATALRAHGLMVDPQNPNGAPIAVPDSMLSPQELQQRAIGDSVKNLHNAQAEVTAAGNDPNSPKFQLAQQHLQLAKANLAEHYAALGVEQQKVTAENNRTDKGAVKQFNKDYVTPAQSVEKSYQMMDTAFKEYQNAAAHGQELPTGAQSMVALSTHLSTTFGNVKGARITKDMIEHHLGARGVSDAAQVAIQRLTNGDVLSPDQWSAFHDLITQSRNITWKQARDAADRAQVPLDFLPEDLQQGLGEGVAYTPTQAQPSGPARTGGAAAPAAAGGANVQSYADWKKTQGQPK